MEGWEGEKRSVETVRQFDIPTRMFNLELNRTKSDRDRGNYKEQRGSYLLLIYLEHQAKTCQLIPLVSG